jgi:phosphoribosyl-ATP pyrophosphohydrolase/phosphoribosyl-AMP cyclohydrolase
MVEWYIPGVQSSLRFDEHGLIPVVVQDHLTGDVRMFAFATAEAVQRTLESGRATFWSRSRSELWEKGATSGNTFVVHRVLVDCDADCLLYSGEPAGPTCHTGTPSCFFQVLDGDGVSKPREVPQTLLGELEAVLESRKHSTAGASYTKTLYERGAGAIGEKIREEADELARAVDAESDERVVSEAADAIYHMLVGLRWRGIPVRRVLAELGRRLGTSGHAEKAARGTRKSEP